MKTIAALALFALLAPVAHAQSRDGRSAGSLGSFRQSTNSKPTVASVQQLDRAKKLAEQARARTGAGSRRSTWAYGSSN
jgi:hypothetical protein